MKKGLHSLTPFFLLLIFAWLFRWAIPDYSQSLSLFFAGLSCFIFPISKSDFTFQSTFRTNLASVIPAMEILALVGILIGVWAELGTITLIMDLGIFYLNPVYFLNSCVLACSIFAIISGSSWTTAGTLGLALIGIGREFGISDSMVAGAVISGCYFGDKMSPLSDTTNLAASVTKTDLKVHILHMSKTTFPSYIVANLCFYLASPLISKPASSPELLTQISTSQNLWLLMPPCIVFLSSFLKLKPRVSLVLGILSALLIFIAQNEFLSLASFSLLKSGFVGSRAMGVGGLPSVIPTELLILSAIWFGTSLESKGYLSTILSYVLFNLKTKSSVLLSCMFSSILLNLTTADQYLSIVIPGKSFSAIAEKRKIPSKDIARALEDTGTLSSSLIPWNSCGAFMAVSLGVPVLSYIFFAWFQWIHILGSLLFVFFQKKHQKFALEQ